MYLFSAFRPLCEFFKFSLLKASNIEFVPGLFLGVGQIKNVGTKRAFVQLSLANPCPVLAVLQGLFKWVKAFQRSGNGHYLWVWGYDGIWPAKGELAFQIGQVQAPTLRPQTCCCKFPHWLLVCLLQKVSLVRTPQPGETFLLIIFSMNYLRCQKSMVWWLLLESLRVSW